MRGRVLGTCAMLMLIIAPTACSNSKANSQTSADSSQSATSTDPALAKLISDAKAEGKVSVYCAGAGLCESVIPAFEKKYGIHVDLYRATSGEVIQRVDQEIANHAKGADVVWMAEWSWFQTNADKLIPLNSAGTETLSVKAPNAFHKTYVLPASVPIGIAYNTSLVRTPVTGYAALSGSEFKNKVAGFEPVATSSTTFSVYQAVTSHGLPDFVRTMGQQHLQFLAGQTPIANAVASGEVLAGLFMSPSTVQPLVDQGAPVKWVAPKEGVLLLPTAAGVVQNARNANAARLFIDFIASSEGQSDLNAKSKNGFVTPLPDTGGPQLAGIPTTVWNSLDWKDKAKAAAYISQFNSEFKK